MTFPEEAAFWTDDADGDPVLPAEPEGTDEQLHELVTDAIAVGEVARWYARLYGADATTVHAAVEATLDVLQQREAAASPPCGMHYSWQAHGTVSAGSIGPCVLTGEHVDHRDQYGNEWPVDSAVPLCEEPVVEPPPVDALLDLVDDLHSAVRNDDGNAVDRARGNIVMAVRDLWASGVAEGRRQHAAERMTLPYERGIYGAGVEDGRKQVAADVERLQVLLDHAEQYARDCSSWHFGHIPRSQGRRYQ